MKNRLVIVVSFLLLMLCLPGSETFGDHRRVYRARDGMTISREDMIKDLSGIEVILVGEIHDNRDHHLLQLETIRSLADGGAAVVVGLEMFSKDSQDVLDRWAEGRISEEDFVIKYRDNWTIDWSLYRDIFLFARERKIPLIALNVPGEIIRKVRKTGFSSLTEGEVGKLPPGIGCVVDEKYMEFMRKVFAAHRNDDKAFLYFCEAQLLRDKTMAWYLLDYMKKNPGRTAVVITGIAHAWKKGMPAQIQEISGRGSFRVILPEVTGVIAPQSGTEQDADYIILK